MESTIQDGQLQNGENFKTPPNNKLLDPSVEMDTNDAKKKVDFVES
jgi:hypothetical protein